MNQQGDSIQWRFVFSTLPEEASLYSLVNPRPTSASSETVDPEDSSITVKDYFRIQDPVNDWPDQAPRVSVQVDQRSGQVNVRVSAPSTNALNTSLARSPATLRRAISKGTARPPESGAPDPTNPQQGIHVIKPKPPPNRNGINTRAIAPSPAGLAIRTPGGADFVPMGSIRTPGGTVWTPKGSSYSPGGTGYWPIGTKETESGAMLTPSGTLYNQDMVGYGPSGHVYTPGGTVYSPSGVAYTSWAGQYAYQAPASLNQAPSPYASPGAVSASPGAVSGSMSPVPPSETPVLAAQQSLGNTRIGDVPGALPQVQIAVLDEPGQSSPDVTQYRPPSDHPPTPYHGTSPMQLASPAVYGAKSRQVVTGPIEYISPGSAQSYTVESPMSFSSPATNMPPQTYPVMNEPVKPPMVSPGPSPKLLEMNPQQITVSARVAGPQYTMDGKPLSSPPPLQAFNPSSPVYAASPAA